MSHWKSITSAKASIDTSAKASIDTSRVIREVIDFEQDNNLQKRWKVITDVKQLQMSSNYRCQAITDVKHVFDSRGFSTDVKQLLAITGLSCKRHKNIVLTRR